MTTVMTAIVVKVLTFLKRLVVKSSHSHDCWSEVRSQVIVKCRKRADCSQSHVYDYDFSHTNLTAVICYTTVLFFHAGLFASVEVE